MNREIKLKAWDIKNKQMCEVTHLNLRGKSGVMSCAKFTRSFCFDEVILEQFICELNGDGQDVGEVKPKTVVPIRHECVWAFDWDLERYLTTCKNEWRVCDKTDTPAAGNMRYCPYCGGKLVEKIDEVQE